MIELKGGHEGGPNPMGLCPYKSGHLETQTRTEGRRHEDTGRREPLPSQERGLEHTIPHCHQEKLTMPRPGSWTSGLHDWETIRFCCLQHNSPKCAHTAWKQGVCPRTICCQPLAGKPLGCTHPGPSSQEHTFSIKVIHTNEGHLENT